MRRLGDARFKDHEQTYRKMIEAKIANGTATEWERRFAENGFKSPIRQYQKKLEPLDK